MITLIILLTLTLAAILPVAFCSLYTDWTLSRFKKKLHVGQIVTHTYSPDEFTPPVTYSYTINAIGEKQVQLIDKDGYKSVKSIYTLKHDKTYTIWTSTTRHL